LIRRPIEVLDDGGDIMSRSRPQPDDLPRRMAKKQRIKLALQQQWLEREARYLPLPDPPLYKPLG
jgi:hypothetical protein